MTISKEKLDGLPQYIQRMVEAGRPAPEFPEEDLTVAVQVFSSMHWALPPEDLDEEKVHAWLEEHGELDAKGKATARGSASIHWFMTNGAEVDLVKDPIEPERETTSADVWAKRHRNVDGYLDGLVAKWIAERTHPPTAEDFHEGMNMGFTYALCEDFAGWWREHNQLGEPPGLNEFGRLLKRAGFKSLREPSGQRRYVDLVLGAP